eukprot:scaffold4267_cov393-Prasinococcus_capsulatus_cf.AAC.1
MPSASRPSLACFCVRTGITDTLVLIDVPVGPRAVYDRHDRRLSGCIPRRSSELFASSRRDRAWLGASNLRGLANFTFMPWERSRMILS